MVEKTNVVEWENPEPNDVIWAYPHRNLRWGSQVVVREYEACIFMRDGRVFDVFSPGRHVITTANVPLLTKVYNKLAGYGETPFKVDVVFVSLKQHQGKFGLNFRLPFSRTNFPWMTESQAYGNFWYRVEDPILFLTQVAGGDNQVTTDEVNDFVRSFFTQSAIQELAKEDIVSVQTKLLDVTTKIRGTIGIQFKNRGMTLLETKFGGFTFPYIEKLEEEDPTYGVPIMAAMQSGQMDKVLELIRTVESMRGLGQSSGAGVGAGMVAIPQLFGQPGYGYGPPQQPGAAVGAGVAPQESIEDKLIKLKNLLDKQLITEEEYKELRKKYLTEL